jgi:hypothetical protein
MAENKKKQWSIKHYTDNKRSNNVNPTNTRSELMWSESVRSSCSTSFERQDVDVREH